MQATGSKLVCSSLNTGNKERHLYTERTKCDQLLRISQKLRISKQQVQSRSWTFKPTKREVVFSPALSSAKIKYKESLSLRLAD